MKHQESRNRKTQREKHQEIHPKIQRETSNPVAVACLCCLGLIAAAFAVAASDDYFRGVVSVTKTKTIPFSVISVTNTETTAQPFFFKFLISLESTPGSLFHTDAVKYALIGLMRDLRGFPMATNCCRTNGLLFD
nr:hypothetical protein CFP56_68614 [Quercus suber]